MRIYELAKELKKSSKEVMQALAEHGEKLKNHFIALTPKQEEFLRQHYQAGTPAKKKTTAAKPKSAAGKKAAPAKKKAPPKKKTASAKAEKAPSAPAREKTAGRKAAATRKEPVPADPADARGKAAPPAASAVPAPAPEPAPAPAPEKEWKGTIKITDPILVSALAEKMDEPVNKIIGLLIDLGVMATRNQRIDAVSATTIAEEFCYQVEVVDLFEEEKKAMLEKEEGNENLAHRAPIVTVMGHVNHGKTLLLDAIRKTRMVDGESGGITQHVGAYRVATKGKEIVFIDTPGHEAFTAMRSRGAEVTDIVILVVAADDGVRPQTKEAVSHARQANVPLIVAINKTDLATANLDKARTELSELGLISEDWGGDTIFAEISAKQNTGIDNLLELVLLQAEMMELQADPTGLAVGTVLEACLDQKLGAVATVIVQKGTLRLGDPFVIGIHSGKVRALFNDCEEKISEAGPSTPVLITGLNGVPSAGDLFMVTGGEKEARQLSMKRAEMKTAADQRQSKGLTLADLKRQLDAGELKQINFILKTDVDGSIEAIQELANQLEHKEVLINWVLSATGGITESDVNLAVASQGIVIGYRVRPTIPARKLAEKEGIEIRTYQVVYDLQDDMKKAVEGLLSPEIREELLGVARIQKIFKVSKLGNIAGCLMLEGKGARNCKVRLYRQDKIIWEGDIASLKHYQNDVKEVPGGSEFGIGLEGYNDIKVEDTIEFIAVKEIAVKL